jgi:hypothetical protein
VLYAREVPAVGGDTMFASQYLAYDALSDGMKAMLGGMTAIHSAGRIYGVNPARRFDQPRCGSGYGTKLHDCPDGNFLPLHGSSADRQIGADRRCCDAGRPRRDRNDQGWNGGTASPPRRSAGAGLRAGLYPSQTRQDALAHWLGYHNTVRP